MGNIQQAVEKPTAIEQPFKYFSVPEVDLIGRPYENMMINNDVYEAGKTYKLNLDAANELQGMVDRRLAAEMGLFSDTANLKTRQKLAQLHSSRMSGAVTGQVNDVAIVDRYVAEGKLIG